MTKRERARVNSGAPTVVREVVWRLFHEGKQLAEFETRRAARSEARRRGLELEPLPPLRRRLRGG